MLFQQSMEEEFCRELIKLARGIHSKEPYPVMTYESTINWFNGITPEEKTEFTKFICSQNKIVFNTLCQIAEKYPNKYSDQ